MVLRGGRWLPYDGRAGPSWFKGGGGVAGKRRWRGAVGVVLLTVTIVGGVPVHTAGAADVASASASSSGGVVSFGGGDLQPLVPGRVLDTREGIGAPAGKVGADSTTVVRIAGVDGVPAVGAGAVVLNVTVTEPTAPGFVTVYPTGAERPTASNLNFVPGQTVPNLVIVKLGRGGVVSFYNLQGATHLVADVAGWFPEGSGLRRWCRPACSIPETETVQCVGRLGRTR